MLISLFLVFLLHFLSGPCGRRSWLSVSFYCMLNTQYRILSYTHPHTHLHTQTDIIVNNTTIAERMVMNDDTVNPLMPTLKPQSNGP